MTWKLAKTPDKMLWRWINEEHLRYYSGYSDPITLSDGYAASVSTNVMAAAASLTMPTLIVAGALDNIAPLVHQRELVKLLSDGKLVVIDGVGHLVHYEAPAEAAAAITEFLGAHA